MERAHCLVRHSLTTASELILLNDMDTGKAVFVLPKESNMGTGQAVFVLPRESEMGTGQAVFLLSITRPRH